MWIDFKVTSWERIVVSKEIEDEVLELIKNGELTDTSSFYSRFSEDMFEFEALFEESEPITVEENRGYQTIEVYQDNKIIYHNAMNDDEE